MKEQLHRLSNRWQRWTGSFTQCKHSLVDQIFDELLSSYNSSSRAYHNITHIEECLNLYDEVKGSRNDAIELAIWYHDIIYEPLSKTNEQDSADRMKLDASSLGLSQELIGDATRLIRITASHYSASQSDEQLIADIDCAILASNPERYDKYSKAIRSEYASVNELEYRKGRQQFLRSQVSQPAIFHTQWAQQRGFERQARVNIDRELNQLDSS